VYADVNLMCDSINTIKEDAGTLLEASRDVNAEKTKYMTESEYKDS
jgi:hypothetical protein